MQALKKLLPHILIATFALIVIVGTFWPDGLDWALPTSLHYKLWPLWAKIFGWLCAAVIAAASFIPTSPKTSKH